MGAEREDIAWEYRKAKALYINQRIASGLGFQLCTKCELVGWNPIDSELVCCETGKTIEETKCSKLCRLMEDEDNAKNFTVIIDKCQACINLDMWTDVSHKISIACSNGTCQFRSILK
jgi:hypothetical protein